MNEKTDRQTDGRTGRERSVSCQSQRLTIVLYNSNYTWTDGGIKHDHINADFTLASC